MKAPVTSSMRPSLNMSAGLDDDRVEVGTCARIRGVKLLLPSFSNAISETALLSSSPVVEPVPQKLTMFHGGAVALQDETEDTGSL